ncbi:MAG: DNA-3-methyladenine glycosylase, partial [Candidatus Pacebacteria bacterium]|nr:DNA-3-methyladenine glycosylase [Candidatus Paceibacterota bacterium]
MKRTVLKKDFFEQPTLVVAKYLLGKFLVQKTKEGELVSMITEVEAYDGPDDK